MRILLTNDDGVTSPGINLLAKGLREAGHRVFLVAPDRNRSACSHSINFLNDPCRLKEIEKDTWSCSGTPVDCVLVSLLGAVSELRIERHNGNIILDNAPDLILSGINKGANLGTDIIYSGTAAAARQGSMFGITSIALSLVENKGAWHWDTVISYTAENLEKMMSLWEKGTFLNINFPNTGKTPEKLVRSFPCVRHYDDSIETYPAPDGSLYCFTKCGKISNTPDEGSDWSEVLKNNAAYSIILTQPQAREGSA